MRVSTEFYTDKDSKRIVESEPIVVDVWGDRKDGTWGRTSRGLSIGDDASAVKRLYGDRLRGDTHGFLIQWEDETTLVVDINGTGRIVHMKLSAATE